MHTESFLQDRVLQAILWFVLGGGGNVVVGAEAGGAGL